MKQTVARNVFWFGLIVCLSAANSFAIRMPDTVEVYPRALFSTYYPSADEKVTLKWILGVHPNACVPRYETSINKKVSSDGIITHFLNYKEIVEKYDPMVACAQVLTSYGPQFELGVMEAGYVHLIYLNDSLIREFKIAPSRYPYAVVRPAVPGVGDKISVFWVLGEDSVNCVPQYNGKIVSHNIQKTNPPTHVFNVEYEKKEVQYFACVPQVTQYGPQFELGTAELGFYEIYCGEKLVTSFRVGSKETERLVMKATPQQPAEGDTLQLKLVTGYGSSSCAPYYSTHYELISGDSNYFTYKLTYDEIVNDNETCTYDNVEHGPVWLLPNVKSGTYIFQYSENEYYKVYVQQKRQIPDFPSVTIRGRVYDADYPKDLLDTLASPGRTVAQCTVAVVIYQRTEAKIVSGSSGEQCESLMPSLIAVDTTVPDRVKPYYAVTDENGDYVIKDVPTSALINSAYTVAYKNGKLGYGSIPLVLSKEIFSNISIYNDEVYLDADTMLPLAEDIIVLMRNIGGEPSDIRRTNQKKSVDVSIIQMKSGFHLINPATQNISMAIYSLNGKRIWKYDSGLLSQGRHYITMPKVTAGTYLIKISGENFVRTGIFSLSK